MMIPTNMLARFLAESRVSDVLELQKTSEILPPGVERILSELPDQTTPLAGITGDVWIKVCVEVLKDKFLGFDNDHGVFERRKESSSPNAIAEEGVVVMKCPKCKKFILPKGTN